MCLLSTDRIMGDLLSTVTADMALRLEKAFGVSMDLLLKMQAGYDAAQARMLGDQIKVKRFKPAGARLYALAVWAASMKLTQSREMK